MKKLYIILFAMLLAACAGEVPAPINIIDNIPDTIPQLPPEVRPNRDNYRQKVNISFDGNSVQLSQLPSGVVANMNSANVMVRSMAAGVEYVIKGYTDNGSLVIVSEHSPLVTFDSINIHSVGTNAVTISSKEKIYIAGSSAFLSDEVGKAAQVDKQAAALQLLGDAVLCDGLDLCVQATRRDAVASTGILYNCGATVAIEYAIGCAFNITKGFVLESGNIFATSTKDIVKVKQGNFVMLGGNVSLGAANEKTDAIVARNIFMFDGALIADLQGAAAKGLKSKESVFLIGGELKVHTSGGALFSEKKSDYSSSSCIKSSANIYIKAANVSLASDGDAGKGINCDGMLQIDGGIISIKTTGNDVNHPIDLNAHASPKGIKCDSTLLVNGGRIEVLVLGKGERCEGVESKGEIIIDGGDTKLYIYAYDDAINSGSDLTINGGTVYAYSVANDGIDSNGRIDINGGLVIANGTHTPEMGIDTDIERMFTITGGTVVSFGGSMGPSPCMPKSPATSSAVVAWSGFEAKRDNYINVADEKGVVILSYRMPRSMHHASFMLSAPSLSRGNEYSLFLSEGIAGGERLGYGLYENVKTTNALTAVKWEQMGLLSVIDNNGSAKHINPDTIKSNSDMPPFGAGAPPMGPPPGGFPPPDAVGRPPMGPPPAGFPLHGAGGRPPMGPPVPVIENVYDANNLPGVGW